MGFMKISLGPVSVVGEKGKKLALVADFFFRFSPNAEPGPLPKYKIAWICPLGFSLYTGITRVQARVAE